MNSHQGEKEEDDLRENLFVSPKILVSSIYSDSESGPGSEYNGDDGCHEQSELEKSSVEDSSDDSTENETCTSKKMKLSKSPRKSSTTSRPLAVRSCTPGKKKSVSRMVYKEKSKSVGHTPSRPSTETVHSKRKLKCFKKTNHNNVDDLGKISSLLGEVLKRLERTEAKLESVEHKLESSSLSSSSCSEKKREVPQIVKTETRRTYKTMMDDMEDFTGFDISSGSTFKDDINKSATERLVKKVKGNNKSFLERDIHTAVRTYYKSLSQEEALKRSGKHDQRKIQRRRQERVNRRLAERESAFKKLSYSEADKLKWKKILISEMISSDSSGVEDTVPVCKYPRNL